jgi:predicted transcriptional regulator
MTGKNTTGLLRIVPPSYEQGGTVRPIDETYLEWVKAQKEPFTSDDVAKAFNTKRTNAAERMRVLVGFGLVVASKHPVTNSLIYTYKPMTWHDPFNLARKI